MRGDRSKRMPGLVTRTGNGRIPRALFVGGTLNQTTIIHAVARRLAGEVEARFTPFYSDTGLVYTLDRAGMLEWTALGGVARRSSMDYLARHRLPVDEGGRGGPYDLIVTTTDLVIPRNVGDSPIVLIQEGMTDPENLAYRLVRRMRLPRYLASTASFGDSHAYEFLCAASEGYLEKFVDKGIARNRIVVTGLPNWDDLATRARAGNTVPYRGYVLVATSDTRETFKLDRRMKFLRNCVEKAAGRQLIFKLHPNENAARSTREIASVAPEAKVFVDGDVHHLIAHCDVLITQYSTVAYTGLVLGKEVYSNFDMKQLRRLVPLQNGGTSAEAIAQVCRHVLGIGHDRERRDLAHVCQCGDCRTGSDRFDALTG